MHQSIAPRFRQRIPAVTSRWILSACILSSALLISACSDSLTWSAVEIMIRESFPDVHEVSTDSLSAALANGREDNSSPVLLDVRTPEEFAVSHLDNAIRIDPDVPDFAWLDSLDHSTEIFTYCSVGYRSAAIAQALQDRGFTNVHNVMGSIFRWANEEKPLYHDSVRVQKVHPYDSIWGVLLRKEFRYRPEDDRAER